MGTLPPIVFLYGVAGVGRTTLANLLTERLPGSMALSFEEPLRSGLRGTFYDGDPSIDVRGIKALPCTIPEQSSENFIAAYRQWLEVQNNDDFLGNLIASRRMSPDFDYVSHWFFDDCGRDEHKNMRAIAKYFGERHCVIVGLERGMKKLTGVASSNMRVERLTLSADVVISTNSFLEMFDLPLYGKRPPAHEEGSGLGDLS